MVEKILVPLDGSPLAEAILPQVTELAIPLQAEVLLLRVALAHVFPGVDRMEEEVRDRIAAELESRRAASGRANGSYRW